MVRAKLAQHRVAPSHEAGRGSAVQGALGLGEQRIVIFEKR